MKKITIGDIEKKYKIKTDFPKEMSLETALECIMMKNSIENIAGENDTSHGREEIDHHDDDKDYFCNGCREKLSALMVAIKSPSWKYRNIFFCENAKCSKFGLLTLSGIWYR